MRQLHHQTNIYVTRKFSIISQSGMIKITKLCFIFQTYNLVYKSLSGTATGPPKGLRVDGWSANVHYTFVWDVHYCIRRLQIECINWVVKIHWARCIRLRKRFDSLCKNLLLILVLHSLHTFLLRLWRLCTERGRHQSLKVRRTLSSQLRRCIGRSEKIDGRLRAREPTVGWHISNSNHRYEASVTPTTGMRHEEYQVRIWGME